jgi:drug/metabolite transporter (DMT)-like permease
VSVLGFVAGTLYQKRAGATADIRTGAAIQFGAAALAEIPLAALHGGLAVHVTGALLGVLAWLGIVNSVLGMTLLFLLLRRTGSSRATSALFLVPALTALLAVPLLHQPLGVLTVVGMAVALAGVSLSGKLGG